MSKLSKLDIAEILQQDVQDILRSRARSKSLHKTKNIDASGDEIEIAVREAIRKKLPIKYYVSQGHIVDKFLSISSQLDVLIADNSGSPALLTSENGTEYFPYESIYSYGEIKSTYYASKKHVESFIESTKNIYSELQREVTRPEQVSQDFSLRGGTRITVVNDDARPYQNPLFKFIVFVDSNDFTINSINQLLIDTEDKLLPNIVCFIDKGVIVKAKIVDNNGIKSIGPVELFPEFIKPEDQDQYEWVLLEFDQEANKGAANFAFLIFALNDHLKKCLVLRPDILTYFTGMFNYTGQIIK